MNNNSHQRFSSAGEARQGGQNRITVLPGKHGYSHLVNQQIIFDDFDDGFVDLVNNGYSLPVTQRSSQQLSQMGNFTHPQQVLVQSANGNISQSQQISIPSVDLIDARRKQISTDLSRNAIALSGQSQGPISQSQFYIKSVQDDQAQFALSQNAKFKQAIPMTNNSSQASLHKSGQRFSEQKYEKPYQGQSVGHHIPKKKSIASQHVSSGSSSSTYKPTNLALLLNNREGKSSIGSMPSDSMKQDKSGISSAAGFRSQSISSQNEGVSERSAQNSQFNLKNGGTAITGNTYYSSDVQAISNSNICSPQHQITSLQVYDTNQSNEIIDSDQFYQKSRLQREQEPPDFGTHQSFELIQNQSPYYANQSALYNAVPLQLMKKHDQPKLVQRSEVQASQPMVYVPYLESPVHPQRLIQNKHFLNQHQMVMPSPTHAALIQPIVIQKNPQFHQNSNQQYYHFQQGNPIQQSQFVQLIPTEPSLEPPQMQHSTILQQTPIQNCQSLQFYEPTTNTALFRQINSQPNSQLGFASCSQLQTSHCSSSGNISSSWLSQSQSSQNQMTPPTQQNPYQQPPVCQCTSCLKAQMAHLQNLLQQQQQQFILKTASLQQQIQKQQQQIMVEPSQQFACQANALQQKLVAPIQPSNQIQPPPSYCSSNQGTQHGVSGSLLQNQSSSVWHSSTSQISPQSHSNNTGTSLSAQSTMNGLERLKNSNQKDPVEYSGGSQKEGTNSSPTSKKVHRGNEDETIMEDNNHNKSETEEEESRSIPDEIDQQCLRSFSDKNYQEDITSYQPSELQPQGIILYQEKASENKFQAQSAVNTEEQKTIEEGPQSPYWKQNQGQNSTNQNNAAFKKNYIELPLGEIPEMKESFYDEASRWSQVFAKSNLSRTKTPDAMISQSQKNLLSEKFMNSNSNKNESQVSHTSKQQHEEEKEELFLYSQGESGATLNRTDNESSFLTSEKNKLNQYLQNEINPSAFKKGNQSPSFEALKELSLSKSLESGENDLRRQYVQNKVETIEQQQPHMQLRPDAAEVRSNENEEDRQMMYPSSTDTKRPPLEYSASSNKYVNHSLTFTPSQYQNQEGSIMMDQKTITKMILKYDQMTPKQKSSTEEKGEKYYSSQNNGEQDTMQHQNLQTLKDCKILDEGLSGTDQKDSKRQTIMSPLPQMLLSGEITVQGTPNSKNLTPHKHNSMQSNNEVYPIIAIQQHVDYASAGGNGANPSMRSSSISYDKEKTTKIINYILNSEQKKSGHHTMKSSIIRGFHRPHVMSQVTSIFPNLDDLFTEQEKRLGIRNRKNFESSGQVKSVQLLSLANNSGQEDALLWSTSLAASQNEQEAVVESKSTANHKQSKAGQSQSSVYSEQSFPIFSNLVLKPAQMLGSNLSQAAPQIQSQGTKVRMIEAKDPKLQPIITNDSRNQFNFKTEKRTQETITTEKSSPFDFGKSLHSIAQRYRSVDNDRDKSDNSRQSKSANSNNDLSRVSLFEKKSPFGRQNQPQNYINQIRHYVAKSLSKERQVNEKQSSQSPYYGNQNNIKISKMLHHPPTSNLGQTQKHSIYQQTVSSKSKIMAATKQQVFNSASLAQKPFASTESQPKSAKYSPTVFDRLTQQQLLYSSQKRPNFKSDCQVIDEQMHHSLPKSNYPMPSLTARNDSIKSRPSVERAGGGVETRHSSCSSGANNKSGGPRKRKFSKIVFEISELPNVSMVNRSLTNKRSRDKFSAVRSSAPTSGGNNFNTIQENYIAENLLQPESPQRNARNQRQFKPNFQPKQQDDIGTNPNSEFIRTHENYQIHQLGLDDAANYNTEPTMHTQPLLNQETQSSYRENRMKYPSENEVVKSQYFVNEASSTNENSKAIVQSLLNKNENVNQQLTKLFGQRIMSKNSSLLSDMSVGEESYMKLKRQEHNSKSPVQTYSSRQKVSPSQRFQMQTEETKSQTKLLSNLINQSSINHSQNSSSIMQGGSKICLPNAIFFNQTQKVGSSSNLMVKQQQLMGRPGVQNFNATTQLQFQQSSQIKKLSGQAANSNAAKRMNGDKKQPFLMSSGANISRKRI